VGLGIAVGDGRGVGGVVGTATTAVAVGWGTDVGDATTVAVGGATVGCAGGTVAAGVANWVGGATGPALGALDEHAALNRAIMPTATASVHRGARIRRVSLVLPTGVLHDDRIDPSTTAAARPSS